MGCIKSQCILSVWFIGLASPPVKSLHILYVWFVALPILILNAQILCKVPTHPSNV